MGHKDRNRHRNRIKRSGRARLVYVFEITLTSPPPEGGPSGTTKKNKSKNNINNNNNDGWSNDLMMIMVMMMTMVTGYNFHCSLNGKTQETAVKTHISTVMMEGCARVLKSPSRGL